MSDLRARLEAALAQRYTIERELGRGGMATVYLAHDRQHDRHVALKALHPELAETLGGHRFKQEIQLAGRLQHPHILAVYDSGEADGLLWFTMPHVRGESLRARINRVGPLPVEEAVAIAREVADALDYAHRQGVIHRDVKPDNIMFADEHALVTDFGIARVVKTRGQSPITSSGVIVGTPAYMSPEQATGEQKVDHRTDVYGLGAVLYEMLVGEAPFTGATPQTIIARTIHEPPRSIRTVREAVPAPLESVVFRAMAKHPADRYGSAAEFARALTAAVPGTATPGAGVAAAPASWLTRPAARAAALVLLIAGAFGVWRFTTGGPAGTSPPPLIAILPFENVGKPVDPWFADGLADEVRGKLAALEGLEVIASASANQYRGAALEPARIAAELGAQYLLVGKVHWDGTAGERGRVRVTPELIRAERGRAPVTLWQEPRDVAYGDPFQVQAEIAGAVAGALNLALTSTARRQLEEQPTRNLAAWRAYLQAEETGAFVSGRPPDVRRAIQLYEEAVALDSAFALAWARLARARALLYVNSTSDPALAEASLAAARRALALTPTRPEPYVALGYYHTFVANQPDSALAVLSRGQARSPRDPDLAAWLGTAEMTLGRWSEALDHLSAAQRLDPRSVGAARRVAQIHLWTRHYPEALAAADRAIALAPSALGLHSTKAMVYLAQGDLPGARRTLRAVPADVDPTAKVAHLANFWDLTWVLDDAEQELLLRLAPSAFGDDRAWWAITKADAWALRGDRAMARAWGDTARGEFARRAAENPDDPQNFAFLGLAEAYAGRRGPALAAAERAVAASPAERFGFIGPYYAHLLARTAMLTGDHDRAVAELERILQRPYFVSRDWLRIDPTFTPLRSHPRFQRLTGR